MSQQPWKGHFGQAVGKIFDSRLFNVNIDSNRAYALALERASYIKRDECSKILGTLELVRNSWIDGLIQFKDTDCDVHTVNKRLIIKMLGENGHVLEAGRSRDEQPITDLKLWLRHSIVATSQSLYNLIMIIMDMAETNIGVLMPGYNHMQPLQPVLFSHFILSHAFSFREDCVRLCDLRMRENIMPIAGTLAGNPLRIDMPWLATQLEFAGVSHNSIHALRDRDSIIDFVYTCSLVAIHLSQLAEDLIIYSTKEFDFIEFDDAYTSDNTFMPQVRNPESLEMVRGVSGNIFGALSGIMMTMKALPSTYSCEMQNDKQYCFEAYDKLQHALTVMKGVIKSMRVKSFSMESALCSDMLAGDWVYYLVHKGLSYRKACFYVHRIVDYCEDTSLMISEVPLEKLRELCPHFESDIMETADFGRNAEKYYNVGGTASESIHHQLQVLRDSLVALKESG